MDVPQFVRVAVGMLPHRSVDQVEELGEEAFGVTSVPWIIEEVSVTRPANSGPGAR